MVSTFIMRTKIKILRRRFLYAQWHSQCKQSDADYKCLRITNAVSMTLELHSTTECMRVCVWRLNDARIYKQLSFAFQSKFMTIQKTDIVQIKNDHDSIEHTEKHTRTKSSPSTIIYPLLSECLCTHPLMISLQTSLFQFIIP